MQAMVTQKLESWPWNGFLILLCQVSTSHVLPAGPWLREESLRRDNARLNTWVRLESWHKSGWASNNIEDIKQLQRDDSLARSHPSDPCWQSLVSFSPRSSFFHQRQHRSDHYTWNPITDIFNMFWIFLNSFLIRTTNYWKLLRVCHYYLKHCLAKAGPRRKGMWLIFSPIFSYHDVSVELGEAFPQGGDCHTLSEKNIRDILGEK